MSNLSAILYGKEDLRVEHRPVKELCEGEVQVSMRFVGLCGSDVFAYLNGSHGSHTISEPAGMGHEASGLITGVGAGVTTLKVGDRVTLEPGWACFKCKNCLKGVPNMCLVAQEYEGKGTTGYITREHVMSAAYCHKLPNNISDEEGAFMEPLAVAVQDCRRGGVEAGKSVLVLGAGTIGLLCMMTAKAMGATNVLITDIVEDRLRLAKTLGATHTLLTESSDPEVVVNAIHAAMGEMPDITLECTGNNFCQRLAILTTIPAGCVVLIGYGAENATLPIAVAAQRQLDIRTAWRYDRFCYPIAIELLNQGKVDVKSLITHRFPLEQSKSAMETMSSRQPGVLKVLIDCQK